MVRPKFLSCVSYPAIPILAALSKLVSSDPETSGILDFPEKIAIHSCSGFEGIDEKPRICKGQNRISRPKNWEEIMISEKNLVSLETPTPLLG